MAEDPSNLKERKCVNCGIKRSGADFASAQCKVCSFCATDPAYALSLERRLALARDAYLKMLDAAELPKFKSGPRMSELLASFFVTWGGQEKFVADLVSHGRTLLAEKPKSPDTTRYMLGMLKFVNEDNKREDELEVKRMTDEQIRQERALGFLELAMEAMADDAKSSMIAEVLQIFSLQATPGVVQSVTDPHAPLPAIAQEPTSAS